MTTRGKVMVVDDDHDILDAVTMALEDRGYEVYAAASGEQALQRLKAELPHLILLDLRMPGMSGPEFRERQLKEPGAAEVPVVILSADAAIERIAESLKVSGHLRKPITLAALRDMVARFVPSA